MKIETGVVKPVWENEAGSKGFAVNNSSKLNITFQKYPDGGVYVCVSNETNCVQFVIPK